MDSTSFATIIGKLATDTIHVCLSKPPDSSQDSIPYLSLVIALLAVFFGSVIQYVTAKRTISAQLSIADMQVKAQVLSANRNAWINSLRDQLAEFVAIATIIATDGVLQDPKDIYGKAERLLALRSKVSLLMNPGDPDQMTLDNLMSDSIKICLTPGAKQAKGEKSLGDLRVEIISLSQSILRKEWERAKQLE